MAKPNTTKTNTPIASGDGETPKKPASQRAADVVAAVAAPLVEKAVKLTRLVKRKAGAARAVAKESIAPAPVTPTVDPAPDFSGDGDAVSGTPPSPVAAKATAPTKPKRASKLLATTPAVPAADPAPVPPPPIAGVTKPATKVKGEAKPKAAKPKPAPRLGSGSAKPKKKGFTNDDVALRAYFIAQRRHAEGRHGNPESDWLEAEAELRVEHDVR
jgi:hypothetical protein